MTRVQYSLLAILEVTLNEKLMFLSDQWWHQYVNVMPLHFKLRVAKKLRNPQVSLHYLALLLSRSIHDDHSGVIRKHHIILIGLIVVHSSQLFHLLALQFIVLALIKIVLDL